VVGIGWFLAGLGIGAISDSMLVRSVAAVRPGRSRLALAGIVVGISLRYILTAALLAIAAMHRADSALYAAGGVLLARLWLARRGMARSADRDRALLG